MHSFILSPDVLYVLNSLSLNILYTVVLRYDLIEVRTLELSPGAIMHLFLVATSTGLLLPVLRRQRLYAYSSCFGQVMLSHDIFE